MSSQTADRRSGATQSPLSKARESWQTAKRQVLLAWIEYRVEVIRTEMELERLKAFKRAADRPALLKPQAE